jgi:hypothetical protein
VCLKGCRLGLTFDFAPDILTSIIVAGQAFVDIQQADFATDAAENYQLNKPMESSTNVQELAVSAFLPSLANKVA